MVLPDTSIWVDFLRNGTAGAAAKLDDLLEARKVVVCGPVLAELLAGCSDGDQGRLRSSLRALPWIGLGRAEWQLVGEVAGRLRSKGQSVALTDIEIGVAAAKADATLWTTDGDFKRIAEEVSGLRLER